MTITPGILSLLESGMHISSIASLINNISSLVIEFEMTYEKDQNLRNAAIDTAIEILQKCKVSVPNGN